MQETSQFHCLQLEQAKESEPHTLALELIHQPVFQFSCSDKMSSKVIDTGMMTMTSTPILLPQRYLALATDHVIQARKTVKALGDRKAPPTIPDDFNQRIYEAMRVAGWAPFHYPVHDVHLDRKMNSPVPWRFYALNQTSCLRLADCLINETNHDIDEKNNIIRMLGACGSLVLVTWLPEPKDSKRAKTPEKKTEFNEEHLAAASAATQNLMLAAKAREVDTYWSSGGILKSSECFELCNIPTQEKLLGAIFMLPELPEHVEIRPGKLRNRRGSPQQWMEWVEIPEHEEPSSRIVA